MSVINNNNNLVIYWTTSDDVYLHRRGRGADRYMVSGK